MTAEGPGFGRYVLTGAALSGVRLSLAVHRAQAALAAAIALVGVGMALLDPDDPFAGFALVGLLFYVPPALIFILLASGLRRGARWGYLGSVGGHVLVASAAAVISTMLVWEWPKLGFVLSAAAVAAASVVNALAAVRLMRAEVRKRYFDRAR